MDLKELEQGIDPYKHWYYQSKKIPLIRFVKRIANNATVKFTIIDVGSGSGFFMYELVKELPQYINKIWLVDIGYSEEEIAATKNQFIEKTKYLPSGITNGIYVMMDVLEHLQDDAAMLCDIRKTCTGTNYYFITVPAFQSLWSGHDVYLEHYRRYTRKSLVKLLTDNNFNVESSYYLYNTIFPLVWLVRRFSNKTSKPKTSLSVVHPVLNSMLLAYHRLENNIGLRNKWFGVTCAAEGFFKI
jgi:SAM-dependent methyltransferase